MCEKCWEAAYRDAYCNPSKSQSECYQVRLETCKHLHKDEPNPPTKQEQTDE